MSKFQLTLTIIFGLFIVVAVAVFALSKGTASATPVTLTVWGSLPQNTFNTLVASTPLTQNRNLTINYVQVAPTAFENNFVNALANGDGPDIVMISQDMLYQNENKLVLIPYTDYTERTFKNNFIQEGEIFLAPTGMYALPFTVDPLVMYWNRDIFNNADIPQPPAYWDQVLTEPAKLTVVDHSGNVTQSAVALGEWNNVDNAKAILSNLLLQAGNPIVDISSPVPRVALTDNPGDVVAPAESATNFYTEFANPTSATYSWNRAEPDSLTAFLSGNLAVYFGFASELPTIRAKNPNLNFDVAAMPQARPNAAAGTAQTSTNKTVFANMYGLAIVKQSKNVNSAFQVITTLTGDAALATLATDTNLPPVSRTLLSTPPASVAANPYESVFYQSALISNGWLDPNATASSQAFADMIESITSGQSDTPTAVGQANDQLTAMFQTQ